MLKLEQINIQNNVELIVEVLEPIVYPKVGSIDKTDDIIAQEKRNAFYLIAKIVKVPENINKSKDKSWADIGTTKNAEKLEVINPLKVGMFVMISKHSFSPITFPIEGYSSPALATIHKDAIFAIIEEESFDNNIAPI